MCGIAGFHIFDPDLVKSLDDQKMMEKFADYLFFGIEARGRDATGFIAVTDDGKVVVDKQKGAATGFVKTRKQFPTGTRSVLLHTRFATKGSEDHYMNNHPVNYLGVYTTHNGMIRNDDELFKKHDLSRYAEVDTEAVSAMLFKHGWEGAKDAFAELQGGWATASISPLKFPGKLILAKGPGYPMVIHQSKNWVVWASTKDAIKKAWKEVIGTPPRSNFLEPLAGDIIWIDGDKMEVEKGAYKVNYGSTYSYKPSGDKPWSINRNFRGTTKTTKRPARGSTIKLDMKDMIEALAEAGHARAIVHGMKLTPDQARRHNSKFNQCLHCERLIANCDMIVTKQHGEMCCDCFYLATREPDDAPKSGTPESAGDSDGLPENYSLPVDSDSLEEITGFAMDEASVHWSVLHRVARESGLSVVAVDYILHRMSAPLMDQYDGLDELYADLDDMFNDASGDAWSAWADSQRDKTGCILGIHDKDSTCKLCSPRDGMGDLAAILERALESERQEEVVDGDACGVKVFVEEIEEGPCFRPRCKKPGELYVCGKRYCETHFKKCASRGCKEPAVGTMSETGNRYCHKHIRGLQGSVPDNSQKGTVTDLRVMFAHVGL